MTGATPSSAALLGRPSSASLRRLGRFISGCLLLVAAMALVGVIVAGANGVRIRVEQTGSMAPALRPGDLVLVHQTGIEQVRLGDVIGVKTAMGQVIVHRVKRINADAASFHVTTQGDANPTSENWTLQRGSTVALVRGDVPKLGSIVDALKGPYTAFAVLFAGMLLAIGQLRSIWRRS